MHGRRPESDSSFPIACKYFLAPRAAFSPDSLIKVDCVTGASSTAAAAAVVVAVSVAGVGDIESLSEVDFSSTAAPCAEGSRFYEAGNGERRES